MISIKVKVNGLEEVREKFKKYPKQLAGAISRGIKKSGFILEQESKFALTEGPTRAILTGLLRSQNVVRELSDVRVAVYPLVKYAVYIHEGTGRMRPRPWMTVASKKAGPQVVQVFDEEIANALK